MNDRTLKLILENLEYSIKDLKEFLKNNKVNEVEIKPGQVWLLLGGTRILILNVIPDIETDVVNLQYFCLQYGQCGKEEIIIELCKVRTSKFLKESKLIECDIFENNLKLINQLKDRLK